MKVIKIDIKNIVQTENSRVVYKEADLSELMHSMKKDGLLQPVGVTALKNGKYEAVFGNRRILAAKKLGWADISAHVLDSAENDNDRDIINLVENLKRQNTTVAEDGRIFQALKDRGLSEQEISARVGISSIRVETALEVFNRVPAEYHKVIVNRVDGSNAKKKNTISASAATQIISLRKQHGLNRRQMRDMLNFAREDDTSLQHITQVAPLVKSGLTVNEAIKRVGKLERFTLFFFMDKRVVEKLEKKHKCPMYEILWKRLEADNELKIERRVHTNYESKQRAELRGEGPRRLISAH